MDAGLITAAPITETAVVVKPGMQRSSQVGPDYRADAKQDDGGRRSFAEVLQHSSNALPGARQRDVKQANDGTVEKPTTDGDLSVKADASGPIIDVLPEVDGGKPAEQGLSELKNEAAALADDPSVSVPLLVAGKGAAKTVAADGTKPPTPLTSIAKSGLHKTNGGFTQKPETSDLPAVQVQGQASGNDPVLVANATPQQLPVLSAHVPVVPVQGADGRQAAPKAIGAIAKGAKDASALRAAAADPDTDMTSVLSSALQDAAPSSSASHSDMSMASTVEHVLNTSASAEPAGSAIGAAGAVSAAMIANVHTASNIQNVVPPPIANAVAATHASSLQMDNASLSGGEHATLIATPNVLEVGLSLGTHGWLRVRAEMSNGGDVSATVHAASEVAYDSLHKELPSISAYLASERVGLSSLVVEHPPASSGPSTNLADSGMANSQGGGQGAQQGARQGTPSDSVWDTTGNAAQDREFTPTDSAIIGAMLPSATYTGANGSWVSVRA